MHNLGLFSLCKTMNNIINSTTSTISHLLHFGCQIVVQIVDLGSALHHLVVQVFQLFMEALLFVPHDALDRQHRVALFMVRIETERAQRQLALLTPEALFLLVVPA